MPLDLSTLSKQIRVMSGSLAGDVQAKHSRQQLVFGRLLEESAAHAQWAEAVQLSRESAAWLFALPTEPLDTVVDLPAPPADYALIATDGSQIDVERHGIAVCYVINIGRVFIRYGSEPLARLSSLPQLYFQDEDLYLNDGVRRIPIEGNYLSARRDVEEGIALVGLADEFLTDGLPAIALQDGTLVRWTLANAERVVQDRFLTPYLDYLSAMQQRGLPVASYISRPRAPEVAGTSRLLFCPDVDVASKRGAVCSSCSARARGEVEPCHPVEGLSDADILGQGLSEGQRSALFASMSRINVESYGEHLIHFFYLRAGREIARVEIPRWVARDRTLLDRVHSIIYDQVMRGQGYPVALARAHEQAIVRSADKKAFMGIVEHSLLRADLPATSSRKAESKQGQSV